MVEIPLSYIDVLSELAKDPKLQEISWSRNAYELTAERANNQILVNRRQMLFLGAAFFTFLMARPALAAAAGESFIWADFDKYSKPWFSKQWAPIYDSVAQKWNIAQLHELSTLDNPKSAPLQKILDVSKMVMSSSEVKDPLA